MAGRSKMQVISNLRNGNTGTDQHHFGMFHPDEPNIGTDGHTHFLLEFSREIVFGISTATLLEQLDEVSVERRTQVARTAAEFDELIKELDRLDRNRERRERYHEILQEEYILSGEEFYSGRIFPATLDSPESKLILRGMFLDLFYNCPYEMHQLTADSFLSRIVDELSDLHKETLYLLSLQYLSVSHLAHMRDQSDRNIRKLRDNYTKKLQKQL